jgi:hypothetical protein
MNANQIALLCLGVFFLPSVGGFIVLLLRRK